MKALKLLLGFLIRHLAQNDHAQDLVLGDVGRVYRADLLAVLHDGDAVREIEHVVQVVADQEDANPLRLELLDQLGNHGRFVRA